MNIEIQGEENQDFGGEEVDENTSEALGDQGNQGRNIGDEAGEDTDDVDENIRQANDREDASDE